jgi:hypothetical protein
MMRAWLLLSLLLLASCSTASDRFRFDNRSELCKALNSRGKEC